MKSLAHARAVLVAVPVWTFLFAWLWPRAVRAEALSAEIFLFDWKSLGYACALGLLGGVLSLIVALATDRRVVTEVIKESARNALVSPIAGAAMYAFLKWAGAADWFTLTTEPRFGLIVAAGYAGIAAILWLQGLIGAGAPRMKDGLIDLALAWLQRGRSAGAEKPKDAP